MEVHDPLYVLEGRVLHLEASPVEAEIVELRDVLLHLDKKTVSLWETN